MSRAAYVAGRFGDWRYIRQAQTVLRDLGYSITYDWTVHAEAGENERDGSLTHEAMGKAAQTDLDAAAAADLFVLVCRDDMADALGCYVEMGAALSTGAEVAVIAPPRWSIFFDHPDVRVFADTEAWVTHLLGGGLRSAA
jgi:hypothetical protein